MCFSAEADLVAGVAVGAIGIDALRHARVRAQLPLAAIPLVFAAHQLIEAFVWWGLEGRVARSTGDVATWLYLVIALGLLPVLVPVAVGALEPVANRGRILVFTAIGAVVAAVLVYAIVRGPVEARIEGRHIAYAVDLRFGGVMVALYVLATCGSMLWSRHRHVQWYGAINLVAVLLLAWLDRNALISVWCLWAAVSSVAIAVHLRYAAQPAPPRVAPRTSAPG
jgi:hypothetical protein